VPANVKAMMIVRIVKTREIEVRVLNYEREYVSDSEDESEGEHMPTQKAPSFVHTTKLVKTPRPSIKPVEHPALAKNLRKEISKIRAINRGYVTFGGNQKGGKITRKCKTRTDIECIVLSSDFKMSDDNHVLLSVPRENNLYNVDLKNIVPLGDLTFLFVKATLDESNLWHRRLGHINFKTINKLVKDLIHLYQEPFAFGLANSSLEQHDQTISGKDSSNPLMADNLPKIVWANDNWLIVNYVIRLQALIDRKKVIITEDTIREDLHLDDAESIDFFNKEIFAELAWMGRQFNFSNYIFDSLVRNVDSSSKFYMYPRFLHLMIAAQVGDLTSYTTKYTSPALTKKVFANMRRVGKGFSMVNTPLFEGMLVPQQAIVDVDDLVAASVPADVVADVATDDVADIVAHADAEPTPPSPTPTTTPPPPQQKITSTPPLSPHQSPQQQPSSPPQQP
nr:ribonuclease H-like domain-containing protein [Tanacetum cinerariifolium]